MTKHLWCWGDIINPDLADQALYAEQRRAEAKAGKTGMARAESERAEALAG